MICCSKNNQIQINKETSSSEKYKSLQHKESGIDYLSGIEQLSDIISRGKDRDFNIQNMSVKSGDNMSQSESASFSSDLSTDEEEEYLNNIIDAIDKCKHLKRTPSKNRFDLRLWRKLCLEEEQKLKVSRMNTLSVPLRVENKISQSSKITKKTKKPRRSSRMVNVYKKIDGFDQQEKYK